MRGLAPPENAPLLEVAYGSAALVTPTRIRRGAARVPMRLESGHVGSEGLAKSGHDSRKYQWLARSDSNVVRPYGLPGCNHGPTREGCE